MQTFQILDRHLSVRQNFFLEASAGTGKTFSIQNILVRLLCDKDPVPLDRILVVTFTRAATRELKQRIRSQIEQCHDILKKCLSERPVSSSIPDYLLANIEKGPLEMERCRRLLQKALVAFDLAHIYTIHGFCSRMLREHALECSIGTQANQNAETVPKNVLKNIIRDFFRTEISTNTMTKGQLSLLLKKDPDQTELLKLLMSPHETEKTPSLQGLFSAFYATMEEIKSSLNPHSALMVADFEIQSKDYKNAKKAVSKADTLLKIKRFAQLFDKSSWDFDDFDRLLLDGFLWTEALHPALLKKKNTYALHYPDLTRILREKLEPIIIQAAHFPNLLTHLARVCRQHLKAYQQQEENFFPDDLLHKMVAALTLKTFKQQIRSLFDAAIIDEFQDTDPIQWNIFKELFSPAESHWNGHLYLVGDPKQSIYSFRQADIYTYLSASTTLGKEACFSLDTNYRSHPRLVTGLNVLFSQENIPKLIPLPRLDSHLSYQPVKAVKKAHDRVFDDEKGSIHFFVGDGNKCQKNQLSAIEEEIFFPFMAEEISKLRKNEKLNYSSFTVLVRDRFQASRLSTYLKKNRMPTINQRETSLASSPILPCFVDLLRAVINPKDSGIVKAALGSLLIGWNLTDLTTLSLEPPIIQFFSLRAIWEEKGFIAFFNHFKASRWKNDENTVIENLVHLENGQELYDDLLQIVDLIMEQHNLAWQSMETILLFLDQFEEWGAQDDERIQRCSNPSREGIKIMTLHSSKGLEFDVVFALGLVNTMNKKELFITARQANSLILRSSASDLEIDDYYKEIDAEKMRQLYVTMTRAKIRLYVPLAINLNEKETALGEAAPVDLFIKKWERGSFLNFLETEAQKYHISFSRSDMLSKQFQEEEKDAQVIPLISPISMAIPGAPLIFSSFTSLNKSHEEPLNPLEKVNSVIRNGHALPKGKEMGILFHTLFEKIPFERVQSSNSASQVTPLIWPYIQGTPFEEWSDVIADLLFQILQSPLLQKVNESHCYKEMPFLFPCEEGVLMEDVVVKEGFVKGVIDLLFVHEGQYYILDWKSNWLGPDDQSYLPEKLAEIMKQENYFLQCQIYKEALRRYLSLIDERPFEECFGGAIYFFIRGIHQKQGSGIYRIK